MRRDVEDAEADCFSCMQQQQQEMPSQQQWRGAVAEILPKSHKESFFGTRYMFRVICTMS